MDTETSSLAAVKAALPMPAASGVAPIAVKLRAACAMLDCGMTRIWELIGNGELDSFVDGKFRKVTTASIRAYVERRLAEPKPPKRPQAA